MAYECNIESCDFKDHKYMVYCKHSINTDKDKREREREKDNLGLAVSIPVARLVLFS